jgi:hypothetical protein
MSRKFDHGKVPYKNDHKVSRKQNTKHYLSNKLLAKFNVSKRNYVAISNLNYRMGSTASNGRDSRIDNALIREHFERVQYNVKDLVEGGVSVNQQLEAIYIRFRIAKYGFSRTGDNGFKKILTAIREIAVNNFPNADKRKLRMPTI